MIGLALQPLPDICGWASWCGDFEEGLQFGVFCDVPDRAIRGVMTDCGRLRGPGEPMDQVEEEWASMKGGKEWLLVVTDETALVWRLQR